MHSVQYVEHWVLTAEAELTVLSSKQIAQLLDCTTWTGAGPGLMDAAIKGALEADKPIGGFKIAKEAGEWTTSNFHPYLPPETYLTCRYLNPDNTMKRFNWRIVSLMEFTLC